MRWRRKGDADQDAAEAGVDQIPEVRLIPIDQSHSSGASSSGASSSGTSADATDEDGEPTGDAAPAVLAELSQAFGGRAARAGADVDERGPRRTTVISVDADDPAGSAMYLDDLVDDAQLASPSDDLDSGDDVRDGRSSRRFRPLAPGNGTVFIDDGGLQSAVHADGRRSDGTMEPRLRVRRIGVARAAGRRRLRIVGGVVGAILLVVGVLAVLGSSLFAVTNVDVTGAAYSDSEALAEIVDDLEGTPVLLVDTGDVERRLEAIAWVESARVDTNFPDAVHIEIREREPLLTMQGSDGNFRVLDAEGRVLVSLEGRPVAPVWITGPGTMDLAPGEFAPVGYVAAAEFVSRLTPEIRSRMETMLVNPGGSDLRVMLRNEPWPLIEVRFGSVLGGDEQVEKLVLLQRQLDDLGTGPVERIDVSTSEVTQLGGTPVPAADPTG